MINPTPKQLKTLDLISLLWEIKCSSRYLEQKAAKNQGSKVQRIKWDLKLVQMYFGSVHLNFLWSRRSNCIVNKMYCKICLIKMFLTAISITEEILKLVTFIKFYYSSLLNVKLKVMKYKIYEFLTLKWVTLNQTMSWPGIIVIRMNVYD